MNANEFLDQMKFAMEAILKKRTGKMPEVKAIVTVPGRRGKTLLRINEIGFDEVNAVIYLVIEQ